VSEDKNDDKETPAILPITDTESILPVNDQPAPREASNAPKGESEQKRDEEENAISDTQEDPINLQCPNLPIIGYA